MPGKQACSCTCRLNISYKAIAAIDGRRIVMTCAGAVDGAGGPVTKKVEVSSAASIGREGKGRAGTWKAIKLSDPANFKLSTWHPLEFDQHYLFVIILVTHESINQSTNITIIVLPSC
jgi:hypothetical protein